MYSSTKNTIQKCKLGEKRKYDIVVMKSEIKITILVQKNLSFKCKKTGRMKKWKEGTEKGKITIREREMRESKNDAI